MKLCEFNKENLDLDILGFSTYRDVMYEPKSLFVFQKRLCMPHPEFSLTQVVDVFSNEKIDIDTCDVVTKVELTQ